MRSHLQPRACLRAMHPVAHLNITVVHAPAPRTVRSWVLQLPVGSTVHHALEACGLLRLPAEPSDLAPVPLHVVHDGLSIWGRRCAATQTLQDQDRVEVCRPLRVDPKVARRTRFEQQGARATGLFARRRPGSKAGY